MPGRGKGRPDQSSTPVDRIRESRERAVEIATCNATSTLQLTKKWQLNKIKITGTAGHVTGNFFWQNYRVKYVTVPIVGMKLKVS